jgi:hypothetical protein
VKRTKYIYATAIAFVFGILLGPGNPMMRVTKAGPANTTQVPKFELDPFWPKPSLKTDTISVEFAKESESYVHQLYYRA